MSIYTKTFSANAPSAGKPVTRTGALKPPAVKAPITSPDNKRSFDARPKPSDDTRREERARPGQHIDNPAAEPDETGE